MKLMQDLFARRWLVGGVTVAMLACSPVVGCAAGDGADRPRGPAAIVQAAAATEPVQTLDDAADDPAVWVHPTDGSLSLVLGTNKKQGLEVYDLGGRRLQSLGDGLVNNVDVVQTPSGAWAAASNRTDQSVRVYAIDASTRQVRPLPDRTVATGLDEVYGLCAYAVPGDERLHVAVGSKSGVVRIFRVDPRPGGAAAELTREFAVGGQVEGMVADIEHGWLYVGEEAVGLWQYPLDPSREPARRLIDLVAGPGRSGGLAPDVEGVTILDVGGGSGWIVVSCQGEDRFAAYDRRTLRPAGSFSVVFGSPEGRVDRVTHTDGIGASGPIMPRFPSGVFVAQDDNDGAAQDFKIVDRRLIEASLAAFATGEESPTRTWSLNGSATEPPTKP